jgi:TfoX/Sxy family transcriptional regulator of competence genes
MAYDQGLSQRIREIMQDNPDLREKEMFGGICFMLNGNMACGVIGEELMVRVGKEAHKQAHAQPHTRPFDFTGRPMRGWVVVTAEGVAEDEDLQSWVKQGSEYALSLPPK